MYSLRATRLAKEERERFDAYNLHATILKDAGNLSEAAEVSKCHFLCVYLLQTFEKAADIFPGAIGSWINLGAVMHLMVNHRNRTN